MKFVYRYVYRKYFIIPRARVGYINNSLHLARKYAQIFVRAHYLSREGNSFPRAKLEENCELRASIWRENMLRYLSAHFICPEKGTVFRERSSRKTVSFEEQIMSKVKYLSIFSKSNGGYCVYYPSNIFRNMRESAGSAILSYVNHVKVCQLASKISTSPRQI